jgi:hypothetical protein
MVVRARTLITVAVVAAMVVGAGLWRRPAASETGWTAVAAPCRACAYAAHELRRSSAGGWRRLFTTTDTILRVVPARPPGRPPALLVLTAAHVGGAQPRDSALCLVSLDGASRRLSPEHSYNFWDLSVGDVDGDGREEVALCTYSRTARDRHYARRFFVYGWDGQGDLTPLWRGSRLCRPYLTAQLADVNGDRRAELVSVERGLGGGEMLVAYAWNQFGFWGLGNSPEYREVQFVGARPLPSGGAGVAVVVCRADGKPGRETWRLGQGRWARVDPLRVPEAAGNRPAKGRG